MWNLYFQNQLVLFAVSKSCFFSRTTNFILIVNYMFNLETDQSKKQNTAEHVRQTKLKLFRWHHDYVPFWLVLMFITQRRVRQ